MPQFTKHAPGTFSWPELSTTDQKAAVAFYRGLFGWGVDDQPMGPNDMYSIFHLNGSHVGAAYTMRPEEKQSGAPPHWNAYVTVENVEAATKRAKELGATVIAPPFDVMDAGRMAVLQDPTGAIFQVWQAGKSIGAHTLGEPGALCCTELTTSDPAAAEKFYTSLFGWTAKHSAPGSPTPYTELTVRGATNPSIGMMATPPHMPPGTPSFWLPYFQVTDVDASVAKATAGGGQLHFGPQDIPNAGRFAVIADPTGAAFTVFAPRARS
jgi:predicted enzyme related to lactoylglutathione lyase